MDELKTCNTLTQNQTVLECPINNHRDAKSFLVVVHNPSIQEYNRLVQVLLPSSNYTAQIWSRKNQQFEDARSDIIQQQAWNKNGSKFINYKIFIEATIPPESVGIFKINQMNKTRSPKFENLQQNKNSTGPKLSVVGYTEKGQVLLKYQNLDQKLEQSFGINIK